MKEHISNNFLTAAKMAIAGAIAFLIYTRFNTGMGFWSVVTIAAIIQATSSDTFIKKLMRAGGTIIGALIGFCFAQLIHHNVYILLPVIFIAITATSFVSQQKTPYAYGGVVAGMTIAIILFYSVVDDGVYSIAVDRTFEVLLGVLILTVVNVIILAFQKKLSFEFSDAKTRIKEVVPKFDIRYLPAAIKVASACLLSFWIWYFFQIPQGYWIALTCLLIMEEEKGSTFRKGMFRLSSHIVVLFISLMLVLAMSHLAFYWRIIPLIIIFFICGYLIGSKSKYSSMGNTIAIAMSIMLLGVPMHAHDAQAFIYERFYGVVIGVAIAFIALSISVENIFSLFHRNKR